MSSARSPWHPRPATSSDIPALESLIPVSARVLQRNEYAPEQIEAALGPVFGVDAQLIADGSYFVVEDGEQIVGAGGWSRRRSMYGGGSGIAPPELDPRTEPARIRAFFVHPQWVRRGIGRSIMMRCEDEISAAGFCSVAIVATLTGELLYASFGYKVTERFEISLGNGLLLPVVRMEKSLR